MPHVVLIVDEDPWGRALVARQLEGLALCIDVAVEEFVHVARQSRFDLVIAGREAVLRVLRALDPTGRRLLVTAADVTPDALEPLVRDGSVHGYVRTPCSGRRMRQAVAEVLYSPAPESSSPPSPSRSPYPLIAR